MPFLFQPILLRLKREMRDYEQTRRLWEVTWAAGGLRFAIALLAAYVRAQRAPIMRLRADASASADLQRIFISLVGTLEAAPLLLEVAAAAGGARAVIPGRQRVVVGVSDRRAAGLGTLRSVVGVVLRIVA